MDSDLDKILDKLNDKQLEAVKETEGYVRVIAGAGSGKTRALTNRYAYIVHELGIPPSNILCITFTNKAAKEMKKRLRYLLGEHVDISFVATLHSFCTRVLREDIGRLFYPEGFIVLDNADQYKILEEVYEELGIKMDTATFQFMIDKIKYYKNLLTYMDYVLAPEEDITMLEAKNMEEKVILKYIAKQKKYFGLDFFDLINYVIYLFDKHEDILKKWQARIHYVMVDEFQDITSKEFKLIRRLTGINKNWFVVGDPDQNIYEWRGSRMGVLMDFDAVMDPCKTIMMNQNYRSTPEILSAANCLIKKNKNRIDKDLFSNKNHSEKPVHYHAKNDNEEIVYISKTIKEYVEKGGKFNDIAVIYRSSYVSRFIEAGFLKENIPYIIFGGIGFYERMEIKDVLSYLRLIEHSDDLSFLRIINVPRRKIGKSKLDFIKRKAAAEGLKLYDTLVKYINDPVFKGCGAKDFIQVVENMKKLAGELQVSELLQRLMIDSKYELYIRESGDMDRLDNISELIRAIVTIETDYGEPLTLASYLQDVTLNRGDMDDGDEKKDCVKIMTAHTAKGLEFHTVFISGLSEGVFPSARALEDRKEDALEEERRLAFVAMTRAKEMLYLTESEGQGFRGFAKAPSRFIFDIDDTLMTKTGKISEEIMEEYRYQIKDKKLPGIPNYQIGDQVRHKIFGEGIIEGINESDKTYIVRFMHGIKPINFDYQGLAQVF